MLGQERGGELLECCDIRRGRIASEARAAFSARTASSIRPLSRCRARYAAGQVAPGNRATRIFLSRRSQNSTVF